MAQKKSFTWCAKLNAVCVAFTALSTELAFTTQETDRPPCPEMRTGMLSAVSVELNRETTSLAFMRSSN